MFTGRQTVHCEKGTEFCVECPKEFLNNAQSIARYQKDRINFLLLKSCGSCDVNMAKLLH